MIIFVIAAVLAFFATQVGVAVITALLRAAWDALVVAAGIIFLAVYYLLKGVAAGVRYFTRDDSQAAAL